MKIHVLSVRQPFAGYIFAPPDDRKFVENRTWRTKYRGRLFIHASSWDSGYGDQKREAGDSPIFRVGAIIGAVELTAVATWDELAAAYQRIERGEPAELAVPTDLEHPGWDDVCEGCQLWILDKPQRLAEPLACKGKLNVWTLDAKPTDLATA